VLEVSREQGLDGEARLARPVADQRLDGDRPAGRS
jgi:hypothetical protein